MLAYFLKVNIAIALFYAFYRLFFYKDTFFSWRRTALLGFLAISAVYPVLNIQNWIKEQKPMSAIADLYAGVVLPEFDYTAKTDTISVWKSLIIEYASYLYWGVLIILIFRFLLQLTTIIRLRILCKTSEVQGIKILELPKPGSPFSFFKWIFIYPPSHSAEELNEILIHEQTHANQWHSIDVLISELACIICWFNPFVWLLKREIRSNLEYLADNQVLETGHDSKSYQYHLLGLSHHKAAATIYNSFNVLPLKRRIMMMNKKRTKQIGRTKYLIFLPLAALLLIISNIEAVARTTKDMAKEVINSLTAEKTTTPSDVLTDRLQSPKKQNKVTISVEEIKDGDKVYNMVDQMPNFPGGQGELMKYISKNLKYPASCKEKGLEGRVIAAFVIKPDGTISETKIVRGVEPEMDAETIRLINSMPKWKPGMKKGKAVAVKYTIPIVFRLNGDSFKKKAGQPVSKIDETVVVGYGSEAGQTAEKIYDMVEDMPKFPGGVSGLMEYLAKNIKYPAEAAKDKKQGRAVIQMIVNEKGNVVSPRILLSTNSPLLDAEAIRVVSDMPKWEPGQQDGKPVAVKYTLPVVFRLK